MPHSRLFCAECHYLLSETLVDLVNKVFDAMSGYEFYMYMYDSCRLKDAPSAEAL